MNISFYLWSCLLRAYFSYESRYGCAIGALSAITRNKQDGLSILEQKRL